MNSILQAENISKRFGERLLFSNIDIAIGQGQKLALIAKNGSGKTTILNILSGEDSCDTGQITKQKKIKIGFAKQDLISGIENTVLEYIFSADNETTNAIKGYTNSLKSGDENLIQKYIDQMDSLNAWNFESKAKEILTRLNIKEFDKRIKELSGGQKKRVSLASVLVNEPDLLLLDEPTNHLDTDMTEWLEDYLAASNISLLMVTHDRYFLENVCDTILELDNGVMHTYNGNYSYFLEKKAAREEAFEAGVAKAKNLMKTELEWLRRMPKARTGKSKARISNFKDIEHKAKQKIFEKSLILEIGAERLGKKIIDIFNISKSFDGNKIIQDFSYKFKTHEKLGIIGKNGTGKTTFLNIISGIISPDSGRTDTGSTVKIAYYKQEGINFNDEDKPIDIIRNISDDIKLNNGRSFSASGFLHYFLFTPNQQYTPIRKLSGGEKRRLYLCSILCKQPNFIILDEPTNDLDIVSLQVLEEYLSQIDACVIVVSHDRYFTDKIAQHLFVFEGNGNISIFPGNYSQYLLQKRKTEKTQVKDKTLQKISVKENQKKQSDKPKKMSFAAKFESENLEKEILELQALKESFETELQSGISDSKELLEVSSKLGVIIAEIEEKENRWIELNENN